MKSSSYCSDDLKMIIFYRGHAQLIFIELWPSNNFLIVSLVSATPLAVFNGFNDTFQLLFPLPEEDHIKSRSYLTAFYQSYGPLPCILIEKPCPHNFLITI